MEGRALEYIREAALWWAGVPAYQSVSGSLRRTRQLLHIASMKPEGGDLGPWSGLPSSITLLRGKMIFWSYYEWVAPRQPASRLVLVAGESPDFHTHPNT